MTPAEITEAYARLLERAEVIVRWENKRSGAFWLDIDYVGLLTIEDNIATMRWREADGGTEKCSFQADLLLDASFAALMAEIKRAEDKEKAARDAAEKERQTQLDAQQEQAERALLARLKIKYEGGA